MGRKVSVVVAHTSEYPNPVTFEAGERLLVGRRDTEYEGWVRVTTADGNEGWAPEQYIESTGAGEGVALQSYVAREMNTISGQSLEVLKELNDWLWVVSDMGETGWVPARTVKT